MDGFVEFGFWALLAFVFVNMVWGWVLTTTSPPSGRYSSRSAEAEERIRKLEDGISLEGAELLTPKMSKKTSVP